MRIGRVIGTVTLNRVHPALAGGRFKLAVPLLLDEIAEEKTAASDALVVYDQLGAGCGHWIAISEGAEASMPFRPDFKPLDAYNAAILDTVSVTSFRAT